MTMLRKLSFLTLFALLTCTSPLRADWTGPASGTASYLDTGNWAGGAIDDDLSNVTLTGDLTLTFNNDHSTNSSADTRWGPSASSNNYTLILRSDGTARTVTLENNIRFGGGNNLHVTVGSNTSGEELFLDFGGESRNVRVEQNDRLHLLQPLQNAGQGFVLSGNNGMQLHLYADNSAGLGGEVIINEWGAVILYNENALGTADVTLNGSSTSLQLLNLSNNFNISNNIFGFDSIGGNGSSINAGTLTGEISGNVDVGAGDNLAFGAENDTGNGLTISGNLSVGPGGRVAIGNNSDLILTGDANGLEGNIRVGPNGGATLFLGTAGDQAYVTVDINDNTGDFGHFGNFGGNDGTLAIVNAILNFDTVDVSPMDQVWDIIDTDLINANTYNGLDLELDGLPAFTENAGVWTATNAIGNWTFTEESGQLAFQFVEPQQVPEPNGFAVWMLLGAAFLAFAWFNTRHHNARK